MERPQERGSVPLVPCVPRTKQHGIVSTALRGLPEPPHGPLRKQGPQGSGFRPFLP